MYSLWISFRKSKYRVLYSTCEDASELREIRSSKGSQDNNSTNYELQTGVGKSWIKDLTIDEFNFIR